MEQSGLFVNKPQYPAENNCGIEPSQKSNKKAFESLILCKITTASQSLEMLDKEMPKRSGCSHNLALQEINNFSHKIKKVDLTVVSRRISHLKSDLHNFWMENFSLM